MLTCLLSIEDGMYRILKLRLRRLYVGQQKMGEVPTIFALVLVRTYLHLVLSVMCALASEVFNGLKEHSFLGVFLLP